MNMEMKNGTTLRSFLLGCLNPDDQQKFEERLIIEEDLFEELERIEEDLIDEYLEGLLSACDKEKFENYFLEAPERKRKLSFAKSLKRYVRKHKPKENYQVLGSKTGTSFRPALSPIFKWALAASLLLLVGGGSWSTSQISRLRLALDREKTEASESLRKLQQIQSRNTELNDSLDQEQDRSRRLEQEVADLVKNRKTLPSLLPEQGPAPLLTVALDPGRSRSSGTMKEITVPSGKKWIELDLKMDPLTYPRYRLKLRRVGGSEILNSTESSIEGRFPGLSVSAELLMQGDYVLNLSGITETGKPEELDDYYFRVKHVP